MKAHTRCRFLFLLLTLFSAASTALAAGAEPPGRAGGEGSAGWLAEVQSSLVEREYQASDAGQGLQAPNRAHNFRAYFDPHGLRLVDRTAAGSLELARVRVASVGRVGLARPAGVGEITAAGREVVIARAGGVSERFENLAEGLVQTLTLFERPAGEGDLSVVFRVGTATIERGQEGVVLRAPSGRDIAMQRLPVNDAAGRLLPSRLEPAGSSRVRFAVADAEAVYPLVLKFIFTGNTGNPVWTLQANQAGANLGISVAGVGDVNGDGFADVLVGANGYDLGQAEEGAAFLFEGTIGGISVGHPGNAETVLQGDQATSGFGFSVAGAGDVNGDGYSDVLVGANFYDAGESNEGATFVFLGSASGVADGSPASAAATLQGNQVNASFGSSVGGAGDVNGDGYADVVVGASGYDSGQLDEGGAFVFLGSATGIASAGAGAAATVLEGNQNSAGLGISVSTAGDVNGDGYADLIVGAWGYDSGQTNEGAAFVFLGSAWGIGAGGPATAAATLQGNQTDANFGQSVASGGDVNGDGYADVLVGAHGYDAPEVNEGAAFLFAGSPGGVASGNPGTAFSTLQANFTGARMGISVAGAGDVNGDGYSDVVVGAYLLNSGSSGGAAFVYLGNPSGMVFDPENVGGAAASLLITQANADFGVSVAGAGDVNGDGFADVVVGAWHYESSAGEADEGAAFVYWGAAAGIANGVPATAATTLQSNQVSPDFGCSVAGAGDVNGDGYSDVVIGAQYYDAGSGEVGAAFVFTGSATGIVSAGVAGAAATLVGTQLSSGFGRSVAGAGDVNGDGYADIVVGAYGQDWSGSGEGAAFVFLGSAAGIASGSAASAAATIHGVQSGGALGFVVAGAGDVNGDGYGDLAVNVLGYQSGEVEEGAVLVFLGSAAGIASGGAGGAATTLEGNQVNALFGYSVAGAGDVNGDGYGDLLAGALLYDSGGVDRGAAFVFLGSSTGIASGVPASAATTLVGSQSFAGFGASVASAGDVNGDGFADVLVGASGQTLGEVNEGAVFLFLGSGSGVASGGPASAAATLEGNQAGASFGGAIASAGDVNGDGYADIVVGAYRYDSEPALVDEGAAFVFLGSQSGIASSGPSGAAATLRGNQVAAWLGYSVATAGDVNGDGYSDAVAGALYYDAGQTDEGGAFIALGNSLGNSGTGRRVLARQMRSGTSTPAQPWGASFDIDGFDARMLAYHPAGGGRVKLEVEACPAGRDFGTTGAGGCVTSVTPVWTDVTATSGSTLSHTVTGLTAARLYHWRARTLYAPAKVIQPGITAPPKPAHGPWRRLFGQAVEADIRTLGGVFYTLAPCRVVDTRTGSAAPIGGPVLTSGVERTLPFLNKCGVPTTARAISANLTAVSPTGPGQFVLYPKIGVVTPTSNLSFNTGVNRANNSMLGLNGLGQIQVVATVNNPLGVDEVHLIVDVNGYFE
jgi:FG-GAP repeat/FG-GAP-like repeat